MTQTASPPIPDRALKAPVIPVSVVILTLNEEVNIRECLESCAWCDDVHVVDSGSEDRTVEIARSMGATVHSHPFESFGAQRNWAIDNVPMRHDWVFHLDADERFTPQLVQAMSRLLESDPQPDGFYIPSKLMFMGKWLKRSGAYPTYQMRLFHKRRMRFRDYGHGQREAKDTHVGTLNEPYLHYGFSKGLYDWFDKHNRYSSLEALQVVTESTEPWRIRDLAFGDKVRRRRAWKEIGYRLPARSFLRWFVTMFVLGGVVEGRAGWTYARILAAYESMITLKIRLLRRSRREQQEARFEADQKPVARTGIFDAADQPRKADLASGGAIELDEEGRPLQMHPEASPWTLREKVGRAVWMLVGRPIFRMSFHNWYGFRAGLLRRFGAAIGRDVAIRPTVNIEVPWMIEIQDGATIGDHAILYSLGKITIGKRSIISQYAHLCAGTHDYTDHTFKLIRPPITIGDDCWIGADAFIGPGVIVGNLSVVGARSSTYKTIGEKQVFVGNPAKPIKERILK